MGIPAAIMASAGIGAGTGLLGSWLGGNAAQDAARQQEAAQREAMMQSLAESRRQFDLSRADMLPWLSSGREALYTMMDLLGMPVSSYDETSPNPYFQGVRRAGASGGQVPYGQKVSPLTTTTRTRTPVTYDSLLARDQGYQNRLGSLNKALERSALAKGDLFSGTFANRLMEENQNFAGNEFANIWNRLAGVAGAGQQTGGQLANLGQNTAGRNQNAYFMGAQGAGGAANARGSMYQNMFDTLGNVGQSALNNAAYYNMMNPGGGGGYTSPTTRNGYFPNYQF